MTKIPENVVLEIKSRAQIEDVVRHFQDLRKQGAGFTSDCSKCDGKNKLTITPSKNIYKCFKCDSKAGGPIQYLMDYHGMSYPQALKWLAEKYNILIEDSSGKKPARPKRKRAKPDHSFRDEQLEASGLDLADQIARIPSKEDPTKEIEIDRYQAATINPQNWQIEPGDDMVMHYIGLDGSPMMYQRTSRNGQVTGQPRPLIRVRWQNPALHLDREKRAIKYQSPPGSGSQLWIPEIIRRKYQNGAVIKTLFIQEGEKKADRACKEGIFSVGIMGIHNLASGQRLPHEFELIIKRCSVENVVFLLDSDLNELSHNISEVADSRPRSFYAAVKKFQAYFIGFQNVGIHLGIYFGYVKPGQEQAKGIDDLLEGPLKKSKQGTLRKDVEKALIDPNGQGEYIQLHEISDDSTYKLKEYFHLHDKEAFAKFHQDRLSGLKRFKIFKLFWKFDEKGNLELAQKMMPDEKYWNMDSYLTTGGREKKEFSFNYVNCYNFLFNRGFGRMAMASGKYKLIQEHEMQVKEVEHVEIRDFLTNFTEQIGEKEVLNFIYRGGTRYMGPDSLSNLKFREISWSQNNKGVQYIYFKNKAWKITENGIESSLITELDGHIWKNQIIDFNMIDIKEDFIKVEPITEKTLEKKPILSKEILGMYSIEFSKEADKCDFLQFLIRTGDFYHEDRKMGKKLTQKQQLESAVHLLSKMTAIGYLLHRYRDSAMLKAVVAMDGKLSEVGSSNGRSGKSLMGTALEKMVPTVYVGGKKKDLTEDRFIWEEVDERTHVVFIDDVRANIDFERFFPEITGKFQIEGKGIKKFSLPEHQTPKLFFTTNHAIRGEGSSFTDRQILIAFSDYYNDTHKPEHDFPGRFFDDWDHAQWVLFYQLMASCLHVYFKYGIIQAPTERLELRKLRQEMGEPFLEWADTYFNQALLGIRLPKIAMYNAVTNEYGKSFLETFPNQKRYVDIRKFKAKIKAYAKYMGMEYNPKQGGKDDKAGGVEYITLQKTNQ